jgi:signal transduction histidine kinase
VLGWFFAISSACIFVFTVNGLLPINLFTEHVLYFGFSLETIMFAWALGDKWNTIRKEKEFAQAKNISLVENQNKLLEEKVKQRTKELQNSNTEILAQSEELTSQREEIKAINDELEQKVKNRTKILERQRNQLKEYAFANSHKVRGPLARMLGLIYLIQREGDDIPENIKEYLAMLAKSSEEMDSIIKAMNRLLESGKFFEEK